MGRLADFNGARRRLRQQRREKLTPAGRAVGWAMALGPSVLVVVGVLFLLRGGSRILGVALLVAALIAMATPIGPILGARVRRREARQKDRQELRAQPPDPPAT